MFKTSVPIGPTTLAGWGGSIGFVVAALVGSHSAAEWKSLVAAGLLALTNGGRHWQATKTK